MAKEFVIKGVFSSLGKCDWDDPIQVWVDGTIQVACLVR